MWILVLVVLIIALIIYFLCKPKQQQAKKTVQQPVKRNTNVIKQKRIDDCISREDYQYQVSNEVKRVVNCVEACKNSIRAATNEANKNISTAWLNSYEKIITVSTNLDENLKYYSAKNLEQSKFQYYTSLHFRSMIAADITYKEYLKIDANYREINNFILQNAKSGNKTNIQKSAIYDAKDALKELRKVFLNRVHEMNNRTAILRDKIGTECGQRGQFWRQERLRNRN